MDKQFLNPETSGGRNRADRSLYEEVDLSKNGNVSGIEQIQPPDGKERLKEIAFSQSVKRADGTVDYIEEFRNGARVARTDYDSTGNHPIIKKDYSPDGMTLTQKTYYDVEGNVAATFGYFPDGINKKSHDQYVAGVLVRSTQYFEGVGGRPSRADYPKTVTEHSTETGMRTRLFVYDNASKSTGWLCTEFAADGQTPRSTFRYNTAGDSMRTVFRDDGKTKLQETTYNPHTGESQTTTYDAQGRGFTHPTHRQPNNVRALRSAN